MDKFLKMNSGSSMEKTKVDKPVKGLNYDLDLLVNTKKFKPAQIEELSDQISRDAEPDARQRERSHGGSESNRSTAHSRAGQDSVHSSRPPPSSMRSPAGASGRAGSGIADFGKTRSGSGIADFGKTGGRAGSLSDAELDDILSKNLTAHTKSPSAKSTAQPITLNRAEAEPKTRESQIRNHIDRIVISDEDSSDELPQRPPSRKPPRRPTRFPDDSSTSRHADVEESEPEHRETRRDAQSEADEESSEHLSHRQIAIRKRRLMMRSARLEKRGFPPAVKINMTMSLEEMDEIVSVQKEERDLENSIKFQGDMLIGVATGIEKLNERYDPADLHLTGWSSSVYENIDDYADVFEELAVKYQDSVVVEPEIKLIGMVLCSAMSFHFSKTLFDNAEKDVPGFKQVMAARPDLAQAYRETALNVMGQASGTNRPVPRPPQMNHPVPPPATPSPPPQPQGYGSPQQIGGGQNPMGQMLGNLTGNPFIGNLLNNFLNKQQESDDEDDEEASKKRQFKQRRTERREQKKPASGSSTKYPKVFKGIDPNKIESDLSEVQDVDNLLAGIKSDEQRKTRSNR
jgi:hypothetical protein